ncbi:TetR/AcrR family transcriptional regulator C-terminal domain-containing protein [Kitasatospora sp. NPDC049285]|uniref:TetR/AcrR family transcriptional regulator n=1 Tax=Kitasatospora sp. NPDC049285 TaxID=3157096 RepID=UPI00341801EF
MESTEPRPRSRRERPAKPALTYQGIVDAAVRLMETEGLQRVTMRRLAQDLDTGPASLYVYVSNTAELHAAVLEHHLGTVDLAPAAETGGDWRERLAAVLASYTQVLFRHAALAHSALLARPTGPHYLALVEALLALLQEGGVPRAQAARGVDLLLQVATATAAEHAGRTGPTADAEHTALVRALHHADPARYPHIAEAADDLVSGRPEDRLAWTFRTLVNGIAGTPL